MSHINRNHRVNAIALLLAGYTKHFGKTGGLIVNSETLKPKDVAACLQAVLDSVKSLAEARGAFKAALDDEERTLKENADVINAVKQLAMSAFKNKADVLADFGLEKRDRKQRTVAEKFETVGKVLATRGARHTMGPKQKSGIHGQPPQTTARSPDPVATPAPITPVVTTPSPIAAPATPAAPPTPIVPVLNGANGAGQAINGGG